MLYRLLKTFGIKEVKAVVDVHPCDGDSAPFLIGQGDSDW